MSTDRNEKTEKLQRRAKSLRRKTLSAILLAAVCLVIAVAGGSAASGVGLYRNTSISFPREGAEDATSGSYYCPDYLLKIEDLDADRARYVLIDAKFQTLQNVRRRQVPALAYKYLFSLTPVRARDAVEGLCVINGQSEYEEDRAADVYDFSLSPGRIYPRAEIVTLTENDPDGAERHAALLGRTLGRYLED